MFEALGSSFALVALSEMGDKTQLLAFSLAARYRRPGPILAGIFVATLLNHALAAGTGAWISKQVPEFWMGMIVGVAFLAFGVWTLKPDTLDEEAGEAKYGVFLTTTALFFLPEMGDKTQLATVALAARYRDLVVVTIGTTLGMILTNGLAVFLGDRLARRAQTPWIRWSAASLFFAFGIATLIYAWTNR